MTEHITKCIHCGLIHGFNTYDIMRYCMAVKSFNYQADTYEKGYNVASYGHVSRIEYISLDEQLQLLEQHRDIKEPGEEVQP